MAHVDVIGLVKDHCKVNNISVSYAKVITNKWRNDSVGCLIRVPEDQVGAAMDKKTWPKPINCRKWIQRDNGNNGNNGQAASQVKTMPKPAESANDPGSLSSASAGGGHLQTESRGISPSRMAFQDCRRAHGNDGNHGQLASQVKAMPNHAEIANDPGVLSSSSVGGQPQTESRGTSTTMVALQDCRRVHMPKWIPYNHRDYCNEWGHRSEDGDYEDNDFYDYGGYRRSNDYPAGRDIPIKDWWEYHWEDDNHSFLDRPL
jgi:hypothetical protein